MYFLIGLVWCVAWGLTAFYVLKNKGYNEEKGIWFLWGALFGVFAIIVACSKVNKYYIFPNSLEHVTTGCTPPARTGDVISEDGKWECQYCGTLNESNAARCHMCLKDREPKNRHK